MCRQLVKKGESSTVIELTRLNGIPFVLNCDLIETVAENPDTTIHLINGNLHIVKESMAEVVQKTVKFRRMTYTSMIEGEFRGQR